MADDSFVEGIKLVGGIAGLLTAAFTIWDRLIKNRPTCSFYVFDEKTDEVVYIRLTNSSARDLIVTAIDVDPDWLQVSPADDFRKSTVWGFQEGVRAFIYPRSERSFPTRAVGDWDSGDPDEIVSIRVRWRVVGGLFRAGLPVGLKTTRGELSKIRRDVVQLRETAIKGEA